MALRIEILKAPLLAVLALIALSGCVEIEKAFRSLNPYQENLFLSLGPPPAPRIYRINVTNGAGKTVMESDNTVRPSGLSANPDLADLDGTLIVTATWSNGRSTTQTVMHKPNTAVALIYNRSEQNFEVQQASRSAPVEEESESQAGGD